MIPLVDNTVLSNFALVGRVELIPLALGSNVSTTTQVVAEFQDGVARGRLPDTRLEWLEVLELLPEELDLYSEQLKRVNVGEAACLAVAAHRNGRVVTLTGPGGIGKSALAAGERQQGKQQRGKGEEVDSDLQDLRI